MIDKYKALLAADMDYTLLRPGEDVFDGNKEAIRALKKAGVAFTIATGRSAFLVGRYVDELELDVPVITSNGGTLFDPLTNTQFAARNFKEDKLRRMLRCLLDNNADVTMYSDEGLFFAPFSTRRAFVLSYNEGLEADKKAPMIDFDNSFPDKAQIPHFNKVLLQNPNDEILAMLSSDPELEAIYSGPGLYDIMPKGSTKGDALTELASYLNIPQAKTFAIGDNENDVSMIAAARYGIAVGNATEGAKKAASYISANYDSLGFAKAVYEYVIPLAEQL